MIKLVKNYFKILETIEFLNVYFQAKKVENKPKTTSNQVVALSLTAEYMSMDSENLLIQSIPQIEIEYIVERSQYTRGVRNYFHIPNRIIL